MNHPWLLGLLTLAALPVGFSSCVTTERVAHGLSSPLAIVAAPGQPERMYIAQRGGLILSLNLESGVTTPFLDLSSLVVSNNEQGLLGLVFSPDFQADRRFFVCYTAQGSGATHLVEYQTLANNLNIADPQTARSILRVQQPQTNHNGGWLAFGPDGYLYVALGDGGGSNDSGTGHTEGSGNAQDITGNLLGKILRIDPAQNQDAWPDDVDRNYGIPSDNPFVGRTGDDEIWCYGLRNPWRNSFDRLTGDLWIADVGQGAREEINFAPANSAGGENYGWRLREGTIPTPAAGVGGAAPTGAIEPIYDYIRGNAVFQGRSVTGGYIYRGPITELQGKYFFADFVSQQIWSLTRSGNTYTDLTDWTSRFRPSTGSINQISSFGEDAAGNLYIVDLDGEIFRITKRNWLGL